MIIRIPTERIAILIGSDGRTKKLLEQRSKASIAVQGNDIEVKGEALDELRAAEVVKAIGRGFAPETALLLLDDELQLALIPLDQETPRSIKRLMGRVIGQHGKARERLERYTDTNISVFGKTVAIIGRPDHAKLCRHAVEMLLAGRSHALVFKQLEKRRVDLI